MKVSKYIYITVIGVIFLLLGVYIDLGEFRNKITTGFALVSLISVSCAVILAIRNYLLMKKFDYLYFAVAYIIILAVFFVGVVNGFSYKSFNYYYFNFIKISEILILFFGIFILRERVNVVGLKKVFVIIVVVTVGYFSALIYFNILFLNIFLLYLGVLALYIRIEQPMARNYFTDIIIMKIIAELFELLSEGLGMSSMFVGSYLFYVASYILMMFYFNYSLNKAYLGNFYMKEKKIRNLINTSNDGIISLSGYFIKKINKKTAEMFEISDISKMKGKNIFSVFDNIKKEDIDAIVEKYPEEQIVDFKKYNERIRKFKVVGYRYGNSDNDEIVLILRNPNYSNEFFYRINNGIDYIICLFDTQDKKYVYVNDAIYNILGYKPEEFYTNPQMGQNIVFEKDLEKYIEFFKIESKAGEVELRYKHKNGRLVWIQEKQTRVRIDDKEYLYCIAKDITRKKIEIIKMESKNDALEEINSKKDMSMSMVAHEIRSPITAIIGFLENILMNNQSIDVKTTGMLEKIYGNSMRLKELVNNILDFNKLNAEKYKPFPEVIDIGTIIKEIILNNEILMRVKKISVEEKIGSGIYAYVDEHMFFQMINNLMSNAIKYNKENGKIIVEAYSEEEHVVVKVGDTGIGIKENEKENIFEEYQRGAGVKEKGTGIGLTLVKKLVEINRGTIWFESEIGKGTTFYIRLIKKKQETPKTKLFMN